MSARKKVEDLIYTTLKKLEPSGINVEVYREKFKKMSDRQFMDYFKAMAADENNNFYVEIDLYGKNNILLENIKDAADYLKLPLEETVYFRHKVDGKDIATAYKVPVFPIHMKRMQHILSKKVRLNVDTAGPGIRSKITGTLNNSSKTGRLSDMDTIALVSVCDTNDNDLGSPNSKHPELAKSAIIKEVLSARADNAAAKRNMEQQISLFGYAKQSEIPPEVLPSSQAINTLDVYLLSAGLKSDIITDGIYIKQGISEIANNERK